MTSPEAQAEAWAKKNLGEGFKVYEGTALWRGLVAALAAYGAKLVKEGASAAYRVSATAIRGLAQTMTTEGYNAIKIESLIAIAERLEREAAAAIRGKETNDDKA